MTTADLLAEDVISLAAAGRPSPPGTGRISCPPRAALLNRRALHFSAGVYMRPGLGRIGMTAAERDEWDKLWAEVKATIADAQKPRKVE